MELLKDWDKEFKKRKKPKKHKRKKKRVELDIRQFGKKRLQIKYKNYIKSKWWNERKRLYYEKYKQKCAACGSRRNIGLHHISYKNLGYERDEDLVALCWRCHGSYHDIHGTEDMVDSTAEFIIEAQEEQELYEITKNF